MPANSKQRTANSRKPSAVSRKLPAFIFELREKRSLKGFTLIELLIVIGIIGIIGAASTPYLSRFLTGGYLTTTTDKVVRTLRKAQTYSLNGKQNSVWGVHCEPELLVLFKGSDYATRNPALDEKFNLPQTVEIVGLTDIYFQKLRGKPSETLIITISALNNQGTVTVNSEGMVDVQ